MSAFLGLIEFLVAIGIVITLVSNYLIINKLWKRRMLREVTESVSLGAALLGLFNAIPFLFLRALKLERKESGELIKQLVQPRGAEQILRILHQLASVDGQVDEREAAMIAQFAQEWRLPVPQGGGRVFSAGRFHSPRYAEFICQKYIGLGLFSTVVPEQARSDA